MKACCAFSLCLMVAGSVANAQVTSPNRFKDPEGITADPTGLRRDPSVRVRPPKMPRDFARTQEDFATKPIAKVVEQLSPLSPCPTHD